jgi:uncharacterized protein (DUF433 family)
MTQAASFRKERPAHENMKMSTNGNPNPTVIRTSRGLTVGGTRLTIYLLMDSIKAGRSDEMILQSYPITREQLADVHRYIDEHPDEVEAEYQDVLRGAAEHRRYWEKRNREKFSEIERSPKTPQQEAIRQRIAELQAKQQRS